MAISYAWEKFFSAVDYAASSCASVQERLASAYIFNIIHVRSEDVPAELWKRIEKLTAAVTKVPARGDEGTVQATTSQMSSDDASKWLSEIVSIFNDIVQEYAAFRKNRFGSG